MAGIMKNLNVTARCSTAYRDDRLAPYGLGDAQFAYFLRICREPGITQERLSRELCIHKSNVARQVAVLEEKGLVERRGEESDRRVRRLYPTERALLLFPSVRAELRAWSQYLIGGLTEEENAQLSLLMEKLARRAIAYFESGELAGESREGESR